MKLKSLLSFVVACVLSLSALPPVSAQCLFTIESTAAKAFANTGGAIGQTEPGQPVNTLSVQFASVTRGACVGQSFTVSTPAWVSILTPVPTTATSRTLYFRVLPNTGPARSGEIVVSHSDGVQGFRVPVSQAGDLSAACTYSVSPASITIPVATATNPAGNKLVTVTVTTQAGCPWAASVGGPRPTFSVTKQAVLPASGVGSGSFTLVFNRFVQPTSVWVNDQAITVVR